MIAESPAVEVMMRYEGHLLYDTGIHMMGMGPNQVKQLMDICHDAIATEEGGISKNEVLIWK